MKKILNLGCGNDTYGTNFVDLYPQRNEVKKCRIDKERLPYRDNLFDEVRFYFAFEHLTNPEFTLKEIYRVLKKGGILDLKTDNASYWYYSLDNKTHTGRYENKEAYGKEDRHFGLFTDLHLLNYFLEFNFGIKKIKYVDTWGKTSSFKGNFVKIISKILRIVKPLRRMDYGGIQIKGIKK
jgi:ubiquinone/menaquinone biosynthesis C-methylase UbiE